MTTASGPITADDLIGGLLVDRYRIVELVGRGGMAAVYRAEDTALGRDVAVKVFGRAAEGLDDPARRRSETALLASMSHPSLVTLYDAGRDDRGIEFLVMELVVGQDLRERLHDGPLDAHDARTLLLDLAEALHVIHARGVVHRDIKPANVLLVPSTMPNRRYRAKLADFGIARLVDSSHLTSTGRLVGTPGYLSPEQVRGEGAGPASDVYALGLMLIEARTGRQAYPGPALEAASARLTRDPDIPADLGSEWCELLRDITARDPRDRPTALDIALRAEHLASATRALPARPAPSAQADAAAVDTLLLGTALLPTAPTTVPPATLPTAPIAAPAAAPTASAPAASAQPMARPRTRGIPPEARPSRSRTGRVIGWLVAAVATIALVVGGLVLLPALTAPAPEPPTPAPSVPGDLGTHLQELEEAVRP